MCFKVCFHSSSACLACSPASPAGGNGKVTWQQRIEANVAVTFFDAQAHCGPQLGLQHKTFLPELPSKLQYWYFLRPSLTPPQSPPHTHIHMNTHKHTYTHTYTENPCYTWQATGFLAPQLGADPLVSLLAGSSPTGLFPGILHNSDIVRYEAEMQKAI